MVIPVVLLGGCATGFTSSTVEDFGSFRIEVTNDLAPRVEIFLQVRPEEDGGAESEELLGNAPVEGTTVYRIDVQNPSAPHRLRAALPRNRELVSESFVPREMPAVSWTLADNILAGAQETEPEAEASEAGAVVPGPDHRRPTGARIIPPGS